MDHLQILMSYLRNQFYLQMDHHFSHQNHSKKYNKTPNNISETNIGNCTRCKDNLDTFLFIECQQNIRKEDGN